MDPSFNDRPPLIDGARTQLLVTFVVAGSYAVVLAVVSTANGASRVSEVVAATTPQTGLLALVGFMFGLLAVYQTVLDRLVSPPVVLAGVLVALWVVPPATDTGDTVVLFAAVGETLAVLVVAEHLLRRAIRRFR